MIYILNTQGKLLLSKNKYCLLILNFYNQHKESESGDLIMLPESHCVSQTGNKYHLLDIAITKNINGIN